MKFEIHCDEANPDILTSRHPRARHLMIGSLWVPVELRTEIKARISALRLRHKAWGGWDKMAHGYDSSRRDCRDTHLWRETWPWAGNPCQPIEIKTISFPSSYLKSTAKPFARSRHLQ